jgi:hypothetical protein
MKLKDITNSHIEDMLLIHDKGGGNQINASLSKLFKKMDDESSEYEVSIKVAALNQLYSTAIQYIKPVVEKIVCEIPENHESLTEREYVDLIDKISTVKWSNQETGKSYERCNLSFASKYIHFLSEYKTPIYDSYIWIVLIGYLKQNEDDKLSFSPPKSYSDFYEVFLKFKKTFKLDCYSNYKIDKFLWQYGKNLLTDIINEEGISLNKSKSVLKKRITEQSLLNFRAYVEDIRKLYEFNKSDSPIYSNLGWLCGILEGCILNDKNDIKTFKNCRFFFIDESLTREDLDNAPDEVVENARIAYFKIKSILDKK